MSTTLIALQIEKGIPLPALRFKARTAFTAAVEGALRQMQVGDSFSYEDGTKNASRRATIREIAKRLSVKVTIHKTGEKDYRVWKVQ